MTVPLIREYAHAQFSVHKHGQETLQDSSALDCVKIKYGEKTAEVYSVQKSVRFAITLIVHSLPSVVE